MTEHRKENREYSPNWGGRREGAGRSPSDPLSNRNTHFRRRNFYRTIIDRYEVLPLEHMLRIINHQHPATGKPMTPAEIEVLATPDRVDAMAAHAAPYIHPRLSAVAVKTGGDAGASMPRVDLSKLSDQEIAQWERLLAKSMIVEIKEEGPPAFDGVLDLEALPHPNDTSD